jgi:hypothetical protein
MTEGQPETFKAFYSIEYPSEVSCQSAIDITSQQEPWLSLKSKYPDLKAECWPIDEE